jgi:hypothetical protein
VAAVQKNKVRGAAPKVRNANRAKGYWLSLHNARANRPNRELVHRNARQGINFPELHHVGAAAYRRLRVR